MSYVVKMEKSSFGDKMCLTFMLESAVMNNTKVVDMWEGRVASVKEMDVKRQKSRLQSKI